METRGENRFMSFFEKDMSKKSEKIACLGIMFLNIIGMIAIPIVSYLSYNRDSKIGFNISFIALVILVLMIEIYAFSEVTYFYRRYKMLKN
jgi:hypothetical protein